MISTFVGQADPPFTPPPPAEVALPVAGIFVIISIYMIRQRRRENAHLGRSQDSQSQGQKTEEAGKTETSEPSTVFCSCCGMIDEFERYDEALDAAKDHHGRQDDDCPHDIAVFELAEGRDYNDLLDYWDSLLDDDRYPLEMLKEHYLPTTNVNIIKDSSRSD